MKETKFIELLNLYIDQQIDPADAALLEQEIAANPARRDLYHRYCRMHRACTMVFEQAQPASDLGVKVAMVAAAADDKISAFPAPRRSYAWLGYGAGLAAAASVAFVFFMPRPANVAPVAAPRDEVVQINPAQIPARATGLTTVPVNYQPATQFARSNRRNPSPSVEQPSLDWMRNVQFTPIVAVSTEQLALDQSDAAKNEQRVFHSRLPLQTTPASLKMELMNAEKSAWQFEH